jgi:gluconolactonase
MNRAIAVLFAAFALVLNCTAAALAAGPVGILAPGAKWEELPRAGLSTSEGVVADRNGMVYISDIARSTAVKGGYVGGTIYRFDPKTGTMSKFIEPSRISNGLHVDRNGDLLIAESNDGIVGGRQIVRHKLKTGENFVIADSFQGKQLVSPNDITSDAKGRIYFTDARYGGNEPFELPNAIYRIDPNGRITQLASDILRPNGIEVSPDGKRLYVAASNTPDLVVNTYGPAKDRFGIKLGGVVVYDLKRDGSIANGRLIIRNDELIVDGMAMDTGGYLYVAFHNANPKAPKGDVVVLGPDGRLVERLPLPEGTLPSNLGFGRGTDANSLYMTNLAQWRLFRIKTTRRGLYWD